MHAGKDLSLESKKNIASKNGNRIIKIENEAYMPLGSMLSGSGVPFDVIREIDQLQYNLGILKENIKNEVVKSFKNHKELCFGLIFDEDKVLEYKLFEKNTKTLINFIDSKKEEQI